MHDIIRLIESFYNTPWAILDSHLMAFEAQLMRAYRTGNLDTLAANLKSKETEPENRALKSVNASSGIGVIPIQGSIGNRASFMSDYFGWPTTERIGQTFQQMVDDPSVGAILFDVNSPGGMAQGNEELHNQIMQNKGKKPVIAVVNGMAASAAYYIASAADEIVVSPSSEVGSIGTVMVHMDTSKAWEDFGVKNTVIKAGKYKWEGNPYEPLSDEAKAEFQKQVDQHYDMFVNAVAKGRGVTASTVKNDFGQGRMLMAKDAIKAGMANRIGTMDSTIAKMGGNRKTGGSQMQDETREIQNRERELEILRLKNSILGI